MLYYDNMGAAYAYECTFTFSSGVGNF